MPYREQPADLVGTPKRYPSPDWNGIGTIARVYIPDNETVGYLVLQHDDALAWLSAIGPDSLGYAIRNHVEDLLADGIATDAPARPTFERILATVLHEPPRDDYLAALIADLRTDWTPRRTT